MKSAVPPSDTPLFKTVFGAAWDVLPPVLQRHYDLRPRATDRRTVTGTLTIERSAVGRLLAPLFYLTGTLVPYAGRDIPVSVTFESSPHHDGFAFDRIFHFPGKRPYRFRSVMYPVRDNELIEVTRSLIGWRMRYTWNGEKIVMSHAGFGLRLFGRMFPLPVTALMGRGTAEETALDDRSFAMAMTLRHPWWGTILAYHGRFTF